MPAFRSPAAAQTGTHALSALLGVEEPAAERAIAGLVAEALGVEAVPGAAVTSIDYAFGSPATAGLYRVSGNTTGGGTWSLFCKALQHVRHWPALTVMPPEAAADFVAFYPWRSELELWDPVVQGSFPDGLRSPALHRIVDLGDDRLAVWQEDVADDPDGWDLDRFAHVAALLGRWNARSTAAEVLAVVSLPPGFALRKYAENAIPGRGLGPLGSDALWSHPWLVPHADLRADLLALGPQIPELLDELDRCVQTLPHGDASPQNLLTTGAGDVVAIDLSFRATHALGFDLGQLLLGLTHADKLPAARLPAIAETILTAYCAGLSEAGVTGRDEQVRRAFAVSLMLRSGFDGFSYELLEQPDEDAARRFEERVTMARVILDLFRST